MKKPLLFTLGILVLISGFGIALVASGQIELEPEQTCGNEEIAIEKNFSTRPVSNTAGINHTYQIEDIQTAPIPPNSIPALNNPEFVNVSDAREYLNNDSQGLGIEINGETRFYPNQIIVWHAAVNDCIDEQPILVGFCPLCLTSAAYSRQVGEKQIEFAVSNRIFNDNILVIDKDQLAKETPDLWSTTLGEQILGDEAGLLLELIAATNTTFGEWVANHPDSKVLSADTGFERPYETDPYSDPDIFEKFREKVPEEEIAPTDFVFGIEVNGQRKAYSTELLRETGIEDVIAGKNVKVQYSEGNFEAFTFDSSGEKIEDIANGAVTLWFVWEAVYPSTEVYY